MKTIIKNSPTGDRTSTIHDVIILDKSGSMTSIARQAVEGVNETIEAIRMTAERNVSQEHLVTVAVFCGCGLTYLYDAVPISKVNDLRHRDYEPCCVTPLHDAIGTTIKRLDKRVNGSENTVASVTIITDGYENASSEFSGNDVKRLIKQHKNKGWMFAYIGAEHDVEAVALSLSIDNTLLFHRNAESTREMFDVYAKASADWADDVNEIACCIMPVREKEERMQERNSNFFKK